MIKINVIHVGDAKEKYYKDAIHDFVQRLGLFCNLKLIMVKNSTLTAESKAVLSAMDEKTYNIALCVEGKKMSSGKFAELFRDANVLSRKAITFIIGGSDGLSDEVKGKCDLLLSFSDFTFTHMMAQLLLIEQIYRAMTINNGMKYHK